MKLKKCSYAVSGYVSGTAKDQARIAVTARPAAPVGCTARARARMGGRALSGSVQHDEMRYIRSAPASTQTYLVGYVVARRAATWCIISAYSSKTWKAFTCCCWISTLDSVAAARIED